MAKKILYVTYDGLTDPLGQSQVLPYLLALSRSGTEFHILSFEKKEHYKSQKVLITSAIKDSPIVWHPQVYHRHPPIISTMFDLWWMTYQARTLHRRHVFDGTWCRSYIPALVGLALKRKSNLSYIFDMRGFWPDERVEGGSWPQANPVFRVVYNYFKNKERQLLAEADHVVVLTNKAKELLKARSLHNNPIPKHISIIPCCVDMNLFDPAKVTIAQKNKARHELGVMPSDNVLVYAGSLGTWYMMREMLQYFGELKKTKQGWKFLFLTKDSPVSLLQDARLTGLTESDVLIKSCSRSEMPVYLSIANMAISFIQPVFSKQASSPTKLAEYMSMGLATVCNSGVGDVDLLMHDAYSGVVDPASFSTSNLDKLAKEGIRSVAERNFSLASGVKIYAGVVNSL
ncbi:glycosyltransferase [uncultured Imperialibacter sp.]|uniref:glycosyltransferase n=1 Tax=uncultured Imperialibacter sp. TaxID=1672639 RepID=UPI0030DB693B|tara:strand:- start:6001 stop:7203 length:1203 start_codon:yes stop_codon:yes gene_type:complete